MDLLEKLEAYARSGACSMHMPGHKGAGPGTELPWALDITEIDGFDNLHDAHSVLREAMDRAAGLWGSVWSLSAMDSRYEADLELLEERE